MSGSRCGVRSPIRYGAHSTPSAPAGDRTTTAQQASVSEAEFDNTARETYRTAFLALARHPDAQVRIAVAQMANDGTRNAAMQIRPQRQLSVGLVTSGKPFIGLHLLRLYRVLSAISRYVPQERA